MNKRTKNKKSNSKKSNVKVEMVELDIIRVGAQGDGVAEGPDGPIYVPMTMAGDKVSAAVVKKGSAELVKVLEPSSDRQEPICQHFEKCGGCQLQMLPANQYEEWITDRTVAALSQQGFDDPIVKPSILSPLESRRRVALKVLKTKDNILIGFHGKSSHQIIHLKECPVTAKSITSLLKPLGDILKGMLKDRATGSLHMTASSTGVDILLDVPHEITLANREDLVAFAEKHDIASMQWIADGFQDPIVIRREPVMDLSGTYVPLPPAAFIQATAEGEETLTQIVTDACGGSKRVADLFAGIGTFTFALARNSQVLAVEGAKTALDALKVGSNRAQNLKQIVPLHRDLFRRPLTAKELTAFDAVVFDPPRAGAKDQAELIAESTVGVVVAVSCNPNTFSRDARILVDGGYTLESVTPVDQFLWSPHVELVGVFKKEIQE